ncbi:MAG: peptidylprolyl isomerase [Elusimicrobiales bacterium]
MIRKLAIVCAGAALCGCSPKSGGGPGAPLARVGKTGITFEELQRKSADVPAEYRSFVDSPAGRRQFLQILIREKLIVAAASDSDVAGSDAYRGEAARMKEDMEARLRESREYLLTKMWLDALERKGVLAVSESEIEQHYRQYPEEISASHILLSDPGEAARLLKSLRAGASFSAAAKERSLDAETAPQGGKIRPFIAGEFLPELESAAAGMKTGETQGVFKSPLGWHILRKNSQTRLAYAAAHDRIAMLLRKKKLDSYLASLQSKYPVEVLNESYK